MRCAVCKADRLDLLEIGERPFELQGTLCARTPPGPRYGPGARIDLTVKNDLMRLFDSESGDSLLAPAPGTGAAVAGRASA